MLPLLHSTTTNGTIATTNTGTNTDPFILKQNGQELQNVVTFFPKSQLQQNTIIWRRWDQQHEQSTLDIFCMIWPNWKWIINCDYKKRRHVMCNQICLQTNKLCQLESNIFEDSFYNAKQRRFQNISWDDSLCNEPISMWKSEYLGSRKVCTPVQQTCFIRCLHPV